MKSKSELRKEILALRDNLTTDERIKKSKIIAEKVIQYQKFQEADKVLLFASFRSEVDTLEIFEVAIKKGKEVYFPKVEGNEMEFYRVEKESDLIKGYRGIREPKGEENAQFTVNLKTEDISKILVVMPGTVFDLECNRIGYGGGYYDKFFQKLEDVIEENNLYKIALAFDCQIIENNRIINQAYDIKPDVIFTESVCLRKKCTYSLKKPSM